MSSDSDTTITPARFAVLNNEDWKKLEFLSIFENLEDEDGGVEASDSVNDDGPDADFFTFPTEF
jgi:hypothetical protein